MELNMKKNLNEIIAKHLKGNTNEYLTAREIAELIFNLNKDYYEDKINRTRLNTPADFLAQVSAEIGSRTPALEKYNVYSTADRPRRYYYDDSKNLGQSCEEVKKNKQEEKKLYPKLAQYCKKLGIETLRIDEKTSNKNGGENHNIWLHADVVGYKDLAKNFNEDAKDCLVQYSSERSYLFSFEVKPGIIKSCNLRKFFFQTVSNSSWANYSYLVAEGIEDKAKAELQLLCSSFNIGFIQINQNKPEDSDIVIQAAKTELDWNMINRIAEENPDFRKYLKNISLSYKRHKNPDIKAPQWDIKE